MKTVRIKSYGSGAESKDVKIVDAETGKEIDGIYKAVITLEAGKVSTVELIIRMPEVDVVAGVVESLEGECGE